MLEAFAAAFIASSAVVPARGWTGDLPNLFITACLDGRASLPPGTAEPVSFETLPHRLRSALGRPTTAHVWHLAGDSDAFLYVLDYPATSRDNRMICGVAARELDVQAAADAVEKRVAGTVYPRRPGSILWTDPQGNYTAFVSSSGKFNVLQLNWLTDQARASFQKIYKRLLP